MPRFSNLLLRIVWFIHPVRKLKKFKQVKLNLNQQAAMTLSLGAVSTTSSLLHLPLPSPSLSKGKEIKGMSKLKSTGSFFSKCPKEATGKETMDWNSV